MPEPLGLTGNSLQDLALKALAPFVEPDLSLTELREILHEALSFEAPLVRLSESLYILELFHGPTAAFKDFGVRFMARVVQKLKAEGETVTVLTATSGDTGGAVAAAFHGVPGIRAVILYPKAKVSPLQEVQIASFGDNVAALEIEGNFDDCQRIVKDIFADQTFAKQHELLSANSINLARLLPQMSYYFWGATQLPANSQSPTFSVPSGNFGNLTAGLYAKRLGLDANFVAVSNANDVIPRFLREGKYKPGEFVETITNAMDIADPSNFVRIEHLYNHDLASIRKDLKSVSLTDEQTIIAMRELNDKYGYVADPHTAIAYGGLENPELGVNIVVATAHPQKFEQTVRQVTGEIPSHPNLSAESGKLHKWQLPADAAMVMNFIASSG
jgi:threonine synthase